MQKVIIPKLEVGYGCAKGEDSFAIGAEAATQTMAGIQECSLAVVLVFASVRYDLPTVLQGIYSIVGDVPLIGATTAGEICNEPHDGSVVVVTLASPYLKVRVGLGEGVSKSWRQAVAQAVSSQEVAPYFSPQGLIWQELSLQGKSAFAMLFTPGNTRTADSRSFEIMEELSRLSGGLIPIIGGAAADDWRMEANYVLWGQKAYADSALVAVFETQLRFGIAMAHGYRPSSQKAAVTRCHGHEVLEIQGEQAAEQYSRMQDFSRETLAGKHLTLTTKRPMGMLDPYGQYRINVASYFTDRFGVRFTQPTAEGTVLTVMETTPDCQIAAAPEAVRKALLRGAVTNPAIVLVFSCAMRMKILGERIGEEIAGIKDLIPTVPVVGFYSFGEQGQSDHGVNRHNNVMVAVLTIGREFSFGAQVALENEQIRAKLEHQTADLAAANEKLQLEIGERQRAEKALREREGFLTNIITSIKDGISILDQDYTIIRVNQAMEQIYARSMPLVGKKCYTAYHGWSEPCGICPVRRTYESKKAAHEVIIERGKRDEILSYIDLSTFPLLDSASGELTGIVQYGRNITEQKLAQEALRQSAERYRIILKTAMDGFWRVDPQGHLLEVNEAYCRMSGYSEPELLGLSIADVEAADIADHMQKILLYGKDRFETRHRRKDGSLFDIEISVQAIPTEEGTTVVFLRDITARNQVEKALQESEKRYRSLIENIDLGITLIGLDYKIIMTNAAQGRIFQKNVGEFIGKHCFREFEKRDRICPHCPGTKAMASGQPAVVVTEGVLDDGNRKNARIHAFPTHSPGGDVTGFIEVVEDITDRKRAEETIRESEERYRGIFDESVAAIYEFDAQKNIVNANQAGEELLGYSREELLHMSILDVDADLLVVLTAHEELLAGGRLINYEHKLRRKDNTTITVLNNSRALKDRDGNVIGMLSTLIDITARKQAEEERAQAEAHLRQAQKMEAIGTLAGGIAHDFNNILWAIMGFSELTMNSLPEGSKERWNIQQVLQASERAKNLVAQILAFSRKAEQEKKPLKIALIVQEALKLLRATIPTTIEIKQTIMAPEALVLADPTQVHQIIINLCTNAAQAMRGKGDTIEIRFEEAYLDPGDLTDQHDLVPGPYIKLTVRDNGQGIAPDINDKIFDPFFTTKSAGEGTGMGLAVVYGILKSHGGAITVSSQPGEGAVFTVLLPRIISQQPEDQEIQIAIPRGHGHILVIDDEEMLVALSKRMLQSLGYEVTTAKSSLEALEIFQAQSDELDLVITDQTMPHMDGLQLSREIRQIRPDIPIILCTGFSEKVSSETLEAAGIDGLLMKPINLRTIGEKVKLVLDKKGMVIE